MKKLFIIFSLLAFIVSASYSQFGTPVQFPVVRYDTITNTGTANKVLTTTAGYDLVSIQPVITKTSGTVAGNVVFYGTLDGINYVATGDTLKCTDQTTNTKIVTFDKAKYGAIKIVYTGVGTMVARWKVWYVLRKRAVIIAN
jgi:hypothetical protein